ncbi:tol-pal system-associated acyl-CoA thioesterase [Caulobacter radicis]|uniref:Tol-pal system-associated acyl-CoA thioesterase n=1 Tax=Caulobacter radicis TaxID=2172650 RepID=A0A2T9J7G3_9CAUL|nr:tol-pal system-associated acyl-CoA thioesterase [Caulobacter radicis]PVM77491.1 tol-pal system-associated acyl-CoA thioesterase [Caulobacter radicis]
MNEPSAGAFVGPEHQLPVRVYYEDTDFTGIVYHANYLRFFERGRSDSFRMIGVSHSELAADDTAFAITRMEIDFKQAARIDDVLVVHTAWTQIKGVRLLARQAIRRGQAILCQARVEAVCIGLDGRPRRPAAGLVATLTPWLCPDHA